MTDLLTATAELIAIRSESHHEEKIVDHIEARLAAAPWLTVERVGHNLVARTDLGRSQRLVLAGHVDTVPANGNEEPRIEGDVLWGLGAADMKGGVAVFLDLALTVSDPAVDLTFVFYDAEEVALEHNGLRRLSRERPDLLAGDAAILGEPTGALVEAGCQGTLRVEVTLAGERAHTARPWMGRNAIHRLAPILEALAGYQERRPVLDGCEYREAVQAVHVEGGVWGNVVPDRAVVRINHRFAPDRSEEEAVAHVRELVAPHMADGDAFEILDLAGAAPPALDHPLLARLVTEAGPPRAKLGWTDVSFFAAAGIPATNFGPGEPTLAHNKDERVERIQLESVHRTLLKVVAG